jgi:UDP-N-acetylglucosamine:LPS N-acetylglucosamine transferase
MRGVAVIDLVYFNAGGGHRAAALALEDAIARQQRPWQVRRINLTAVLDPKSSFKRVMGFDPEALYNRRLQRGWTLGMAQELKLLQAMIRMAHRPMLRVLSRHWARTAPDLVVSLVPNFNRVLYESVRRARPGVPFATVLTDMADHPPHFWIEPGQDQTLICGTAFARAQALAAGYAPERIALVSGMVLRPSFYGPTVADRDARRVALGLEPGRPTGVVMFGGQGSRQMLRIARDLDGVQLVLMCGHNEALAGELRALRRAAPHAVFGFTDDVPGVMRLADFFIGKPGPGSLSEAVHLGLPVVTFRNAWTMPQERYNARWVLDHGVGRVVPSLDELPAAVAEVLERLPALREAAAGLHNRAVFEVPELLAGLLERAAESRPRHAVNG